MADLEPNPLNLDQPSSSSPDLSRGSAWMAGTSPAMTGKESDAPGSDCALEQPATAAMPVPEQQRGRGRGRPFQKGQSGNPAGRPPGIRNKSGELAESLLAGEEEALTKKAVEMALGGDGAAMRLCLERLVAPRRERAVRLPLPDLRNAVDLADAMAVISASVANGGITPSEASALGTFVDTFRKAIETADFEKRLEQLETLAARQSNHY